MLRANIFFCGFTTWKKNNLFFFSFYWHSWNNIIKINIFSQNFKPNLTILHLFQLSFLFLHWIDFSFWLKYYNNMVNPLLCIFCIVRCILYLTISKPKNLLIKCVVFYDTITLPQEMEQSLVLRSSIVLCSIILTQQKELIINNMTLFHSKGIYYLESPNPMGRAY